MAQTYLEAACVDCGKVKQVRWNAELGRGRCRACRSRMAPTALCGNCGRDRRVNARRADGAALCVTCYATTRVSSDICDKCSAIGPLAVRAGGKGGHEQSLCGRCYRHPKRECGVCGRTRRVALKATAFEPDICPTCFQAPMVNCSVCGQHALGRRTTNHGKPWCFGCQAADRIDQLLTGPDGSVDASLHDVREALVATNRPRTILSNWTRTQSLVLLARLAQQPEPLTHERLDIEGDRFSVTYLRALLVASGALPGRDENQTRLQRFAACAIESVDHPQHRQVLSRYARWHVLARAKPDRHGQLTANVAGRCRQEIRAAQLFLDHILSRETSLDACRQSDVDSWLGTQRERRLPFLRWLHDDGHLVGISLPPPAPVIGPGARNDQDQHWAQVRRLLHQDRSAPVEDRVVACLVLLYAQQLSTIAALTIDDTFVQPDGTYLRLGSEPVLLIPALAALIEQLPVDKPFGAAHTLADERWLFPGKNAGQHQHPKSLMLRLNALGITTRLSRNTAMLHLASTVPPAVFASLVGISIGAATRWAEHAGGNWTTYAADRRR